MKPVCETIEYRLGHLDGRIEANGARRHELARQAMNLFGDKLPKSPQDLAKKCYAIADAFIAEGNIG